MAFSSSAGTGQPFMTVSFKMDITTSGTHNGLFITTGIQNGQNAQMNQFGFVQPTNPIMNTSQLSLMPTTQTSAIEAKEESRTTFPR
jgi:hypothetical protein